MSSRTRAEIIADVTTLLQDWPINASARADVLELLYHDLKQRAKRHLSSERRDHTLSTTALVHESYLRLARQDGPWHNREQFLAVASRIMRRVLVDHARARSRQRRGAQFRVELTEVEAPGVPEYADLLALDSALDALATEDERSARLVELRFFAGLTQEEAAVALSVSPATIARDWTFARAWLFRKLRSDLPLAHEPRGG
jgi:RNA polymerase sigma factor (TIGR02999 family)